MKNPILKIHILLIAGCIEIALSLLMRDMDVPFWFHHLLFGIFLLGFWAFFMIIYLKFKGRGD